MHRRQFWTALLMACALMVWPYAQPVLAQDSDDDTAVVEDGTEEGDVEEGGDDAEEGDDTEAGDDADLGEDGDEGGALRIVPPKGRVLVGKNRRFRGAGGSTQGLSFILADASTPEAASLDADGTLNALEGGWAIVGLEDALSMEIVATTDTIWLMGGPTRIGRRGGRAFAANDTLSTVIFPANASSRVLTVLLEKRGLSELPEKAKGKGTAIAVFEFDVTDADTGEDVGGTEGFDELVTLTLSYDEDLIPEGVIEEDLVIATFDEAEELWEEIVGDAVLDVDLEGNTITVGITHASLWAVMAGGTVEPRATAVRAAGWGALKKRSLRR